MSQLGESFGYQCILGYTTLRALTVHIHTYTLQSHHCLMGVGRYHRSPNATLNLLCFIQVHTSIPVHLSVQVDSYFFLSVKIIDLISKLSTLTYIYWIMYFLMQVVVQRLEDGGARHSRISFADSRRGSIPDVSYHPTMRDTMCFHAITMMKVCCATIHIIQF